MLFNECCYNEVGYNAKGITIIGSTDIEQRIYRNREGLADTSQRVYRARSAFADTIQRAYLSRESFAESVMHIYRQRTGLVDTLQRVSLQRDGSADTEQRIYLICISFADTEQVITVAKLPKGYLVTLYDKHHNLLAVLEQPLNARYNRRIGEASEVGFSLPASDPKAQLFEQARYFNLYRGEERKVSARIEKRDTSGNPYTVSGYTNEIKLRDYTTPSSWTYDGWEAMDAVRDLLMEFRTFVKQSKADWDASESYNIDTNTQPTRNGDICLAKRGNGHYYSEGYLLIQPIDLGTDIFKIDRIRWQQTVGEYVAITVQTRTGPSPTPDSSWTAWSTAQSVAVPDDSSITGVPCTSPTDRYIQVKLNLSTQDTETPNEEKTTFGFTPILHALEVVARYKTALQVSNVPESIGLQLQGVEFSYNNHLDAMIQLCEKIKYEWEIDGDDYLILAPKLGTDKSHEVILHEGINTNITVLRDEPGEIVNVLTALGAGDGLAQLRLVLQDDASIELYGRRTGKYENKDVEDPAILLAEAQEYLDKMAWPQLELQADTVIDPSWPDIRVGDYIRVVSPKGIDAVVRILEENRQCADAEAVTLGLNTELKNIIDMIVGGAKKILPTPKVATPTNLAAIGGQQFVEIVWTGSADYFVIEHSTDGISYTILEQQWAGRRYRHQGLELGSQHWYKVSAVRDGIRSTAAGPASALAKDEVPPAAPTGVSATSIIKGIKVTCAVPPEPDWALTECHVSTVSGFEPGEDTLKMVGKQNSFEITSLEPGVFYYCRVIHVDESQNKSEASIEVSATADYVQGNDISTHATVEGNLAYVASGTSGNGDRIYLPWPENRYPHINPSAKGLMSYDHTKSGYSQELEVYATEPIWDGNQWYFDVYGILKVPGIPSGWASLSFSGGEATSGASAANTTLLQVKLTATPYNPGIPGTVSLEVSYKTQSAPEWTIGWPTVNVVAVNGVQGIKTLEKTGLPSDIYQVKVKVLESSNIGALGAEWQYAADQILYNGAITWMAMS